MPGQDGLDPDQLRGLRRSHRDSGTILDRIAHHLAEHEGYVAFSGGKDSLVTLDLARRVDPDVPVAFFDSGLEYPETYTYIAELADTWSSPSSPAAVNGTTTETAAAPTGPCASSSSTNRPSAHTPITAPASCGESAPTNHAAEPVDGRCTTPRWPATSTVTATDAAPPLLSNAQRTGEHSLDAAPVRMSTDRSGIGTATRCGPTSHGDTFR